MKKVLLGCILLFVYSFLGACSDRVQSVDTKPYDGQRLHVAVLGNIPEVREKQIVFDKVQFTALEKAVQNSNYDAILITKENLPEAAQEQYKPTYKKSSIPIFFIQTTKSYLPFIAESLSYENAPEVDDGFYATGIIFEGNTLRYWGYGLYNDIENKKNIEDVYSRIFETIVQDKAKK